MTSIFKTIFDLNSTSYLFLVIWWFGAGIILSMMPKKTMLICGQYHKRWYGLPVLLMLLPYVFWAGYRGYVGDTAVYASSFTKSASSLMDIPNVIRNSVDWGFYGMMVLLKSLGVRSVQMYFLIMAALQLLCIAYIFRRYSSSFWISFFMFVASTDYLSWVHNGMRQFTAVCITFAAFELLVRKKYAWFGIAVLIAATFHASALLMIPFAYVMVGPALNKKSFLMIGAVVLMLPMIDSVIPFMEQLLADTQYGDIMSGEIWEADDGTNILRVLVYSAPAMIVLLGFRYLRGNRDRATNICVNATLITMAIYFISTVTSGIYIGRMPIYTTLHGYVILPKVINMIFEKSTAKFIKFLLVGCYLAFFMFQMNAWGVLNK